MNIVASRSLVVGMFFCVLCAFSLVVQASERDRVLTICETDYKLSLNHDCPCLADTFVKQKAAMGELGQYDRHVLRALNSQCRKMDNLNQTYAECMINSKMINATIETYCGCTVDELDKIQAAAGKVKDSTVYSMSDAHMARQACDTKYMSKTRETKLSLEERWRKNASDFEYKKAIAEGYTICTDYGVAQGQSAEKTKLRRYVNSFCPYIKDVMASIPTTERDRIINNVLQLEEKLYKTYDAEIAGISAEWRATVSPCETQDKACQATCKENQAKTGRPTCGCGTRFVTCLGNVSLDPR